ncbi:hypothetical protein KO481_31360 [Nocardia sp. NEAU-G5]|uniref:Uncharacterized protein n=1 Tax=Nocardia albiluteola TaxID=2842303 RepID=A0ABS6B6S3_9NOCA|nr:hypothetical protein [Nocardia albiluteola]MBU3066003.1 hypothetical protein [Nocardia albiluteola]
MDALHENDIGVRIITGDHPVTAAAIAHQLGIDTETVTTGADLDRLDDDAQAALIERSTVFAVSAHARRCRSSPLCSGRAGSWRWPATAATTRRPSAPPISESELPHADPPTRGLVITPTDLMMDKLMMLEPHQLDFIALLQIAWQPRGHSAAAGVDRNAQPKARDHNGIGEPGLRQRRNRPPARPNSTVTG